MNPTATPLSRVMIVDDTPLNLQLLETMLRGQGYEVFALPDGEMALTAAGRDRPDLILLDILMPKMDGYEVCTRLKADPALKDIPVIFISALSETWDKARAFRVGGVDYIPKPFQLEEVEARVRSHLQLSRQRKELQLSYERLRELERLRDGLVHMLVHDMRAPLGAIRMTLDLVYESLAETNVDLAQLVEVARGSSASLTEMVSQLLDISRFEAGQMPMDRQPGDLVALARATRASLAALAGARELRLTGVPNLPAVFDAGLLARVLTNLVSNALKFTHDGGAVVTQIECVDGQARLAVTDHGPGIPPEFHERIFQKFGQVGTRSGRVGTGLGLTFCKLAVEAHGGRIGVESQVGQGSTFWFTVPLP